MSTLHLVNHAPARSDALASCLAVLRPGDGLLLLEDGVFAALDATLGTSPDDVQLLVLEADAAARGLGSRIGDRFRRVDYAAFVQACADHDRVVSWS